MLREYIVVTVDNSVLTLKACLLLLHCSSTEK